MNIATVAPTRARREGDFVEYSLIHGLIHGESETLLKLNGPLTLSSVHFTASYDHIHGNAAEFVTN